MRGFKKHPVYPVFVHQDGRILKNGKIAKCSKRPDGYFVVSVGGRGAPVVRVHHLVLETFVSNCPDGMNCRHLDGDPSNNALSNLAWGTQSEQVADKKAHGTFNPPPRVGRPKGPEFKLALAQAVRDYINGAGTSRVVSAMYGVSRTHLLREVNRELEGGRGPCA